MATVAKEAQGCDHAGGARCALHMGGHGRAWLPGRRDLRRPEVWKRGFTRAVLFVVWVWSRLCYAMSRAVLRVVFFFFGQLAGRS
jgi:hypothetical protein